MIEKVLQKIVDLLNREKEKPFVLQSEKTIEHDNDNQEQENMSVIDYQNENNQKGAQKNTDKLKDKLAKFIPQGNALANTNWIINLLCETLQEYSLSNSMKIPALSLYVSGTGHDELLQTIITTLDFENELRLKLTHKSIFAAADNNCKWSFYFEKPQNELAKEITEGIFLLERKVDDTQEPDIPANLATLAQVIALKGELLKENYLLDVNDVEVTQFFNIGRSNEKYIQLDNGNFHENFIAIKDNERQGHISRQHACIIFDRQKGFCLKADKTDKTFLFRDGKKISLKENPALQDGDQIQLCVKPNDVVLRFEFIDKNSKTIKEDRTIKTSTNEGNDHTPTEVITPQPQSENNEEMVVEKPKSDFLITKESFILPTLDLFTDYPEKAPEKINDEIENKKQIIKQTLNDFGIDISDIIATVGATITLYELVLARGVSANKIKPIDEDIARALRVPAIRIISPFKDRGTIALEIPNNKSQIVGLKSVLKTSEFKNCSHELPLALGKTIDNKPLIIDLAEVFHILIGGATGKGKSVCLNAIISSLLYTKSPLELKLVLIDPKVNEFSTYKKLGNGFNAPNIQKIVFTNNFDEIFDTLQALKEEMNRRLMLFEKANVRNIQEYNANKTPMDFDYLPRIVLVIDEFVDVLAGNKANEYILLELVRKSRAQGIHLIVATQRPSAKQCSSDITSQFTARIAFKVAKWQDSKIILDDNGAEKLIGKGDMLLSINSEVERLQGAFISTDEVKNMVEFIEKEK